MLQVVVETHSFHSLGTRFLTVCKSVGVDTVKRLLDPNGDSVRCRNSGEIFAVLCVLFVQREWRETRRSTRNLRGYADELSLLEIGFTPNSSTASPSACTPDCITKVMPWRVRTPGGISGSNDVYGEICGRMYDFCLLLTF